MSYGAASGPRQGVAWRFDEFDVDAQRNILKRAGARVPITPKALETLIYLLQHKGQTVSKTDLLQAVWAGAVVEDNTVAVTMTALRRALGDNPKEARYVITVPGIGYRFIADAEAHSREDSNESSRRFSPVGAFTDVWSIGTAVPAGADWPLPLDPAESVGGKTRAEWLTTWWRYVLERPSDGHPLTLEGPDLGEATIVDGVALLFKTFLQTAVSDRRCHMPGGVPVLVPIRVYNIDNVGAKPGEEMPEPEMLGYLKRMTDDLDELVFEVDGAVVMDIRRFRTGPQRFNFQLGLDSLYTSMGLNPPGPIDPAFCDGYVALLPPPPPGEHTVRFGGTGRINGERVRREATYHLTVD